MSEVHYLISLRLLQYSYVFILTLIRCICVVDYKNLLHLEHGLGDKITV